MALHDQLNCVIDKITDTDHKTGYNTNYLL